LIDRLGSASSSRKAQPSWPDVAWLLTTTLPNIKARKLRVAGRQPERNHRLAEPQGDAIAKMPVDQDDG
jgi:hypothetical protein